MNKINLIIGREYWTRVKSRTFLLTTFLAPVGIILLYAFLFWLMSRGSDDKKNIEIIDQAGIVEEADLNRNNLTFTLITDGLDPSLERYKNKEIDGVLVLPPLDSAMKKYDMQYYSDNQLALDESSSIESMFRKKIRNFKVQAFGIDKAQLDLIDTDIELNPNTVEKTDKKVSSLTSTISSVLGGAVGTVLFLVIMVFGSQVMRGVNEEKINRIVEVVISSVKPFELMLGKVIGVGLVGLTQFVIWGILLTVLSLIAMPMLGLESQATEMMNNEGVQEMMANEGVQSKMQQVMSELSGMNWGLIISMGVFYFLIGYILYASLYAAIGAAVGDDVNEAQSLVMIASLPLVIAFYIGFAAVQAPNSTLAIWSSIFPLTAPVVMPVRLPNDPAMWQIGLSMVSCILFSVFMVWLASRIYRVGILMYGKKASFKELGKWIFYKG